MKIKNRYTDDTIFELHDANTTIKDVVLAAIKSRADLEWANLKGADLEGADLYQVSGIGRVGRVTTYDKKNNKIICGCFYGTLEQFKERVQKVYPSGRYGDQYRAAIAYFKAISGI